MTLHDRIINTHAKGGSTMNRRIKGINQHPFKKKGAITMFVLGVACFMICGGYGISSAGDAISYSCSAQVYDAFEKERLDAFTEKSNIGVAVTICSSGTAISRLENDLSDVASTVIRLSPQYIEKGYVETMLCKDPLVVMAHPACAVDNLSEHQLRGIFSGEITNWKEVGGPDKQIVVVIPGKETGAYENFRQMVMRGEELAFDLESHISTLVIETTRRFPYSISFITYGAVDWKKLGLRELKINGVSPREKGYPYYQVYSFVSKGQPKGAVKTFIDYALDEGRDIVTDKGMIPYK